MRQFCLVVFQVAWYWHPSQGLGEGCRASGAFVGHRTPGTSRTKVQLLVTTSAGERAYLRGAGFWPPWRQVRQADPMLTVPRGLHGT